MVRRAGEGVPAALPPRPDRQPAAGAAPRTALCILAPDDPRLDPLAEGLRRAGLLPELLPDPAAARVRAQASELALALIDRALPGSAELLAALRCAQTTWMVPTLAVYPPGLDPERPPALEVLAGAHLGAEAPLAHLLARLQELLALRAAPAEPRVRVVLPTTPADLEAAQRVAERLLAQTRLDERGAVGLAAAFREAIANAAQHGNRDEPARRIRVLFALSRAQVAITVTDEGAGFDHRAALARGHARDPVAVARERHAQGRRGGLGLLLMQRCADAVLYNERGNEVTLLKRLP
ncbi:MAG: hypothetical protein KatS3mg102_2510 [Planctomycetota bacterium]|nr:MAG: hypothetical protein KatS3mg102_2510 [Planctomycetota bacterium]